MSSRLPILIVVLMVSAPATADIQVASDYFIRQVLQDPIREDVQHILDQNDDEGDGGGDPINAAPTISAIDDVIKAAGTSTNWIDFVIGDDESDAGDLILTKASSNETLVPPANIVLSTGADPANRRVRVTLAAGQTGYADITLTVSDGDKTAEEVFRITANTAPTIGTLDDQIIDMDSNTGAMAFSIGDAETGVDDLTLTKSSSNETLVSLSGIVFGGSGASRNVTVTPATGQTGSVEIIIGVSDGEMTATDPFTLTVNMTAGGVWIDVPTTIIGDGTSVPAFSVMKYEAKNDGTGNAISQAGGLPFATIDLPTMIIKCENLGGGSHLITETEWLAIANNARAVNANWTGGTVGSGLLVKGHSDNSPSAELAASNDDDNGYEGTGNSVSSGAEQRRTLFLSNGEVIWDLSGNVAERSFCPADVTGCDPNETGMGTGSEYAGVTGLGVKEYDTAGMAARLKPGSYTSAQGMGVLYNWTTLKPFLRGGYRSESSYSTGAFALDANGTEVNNTAGFRCAIP